MGGLGGEVGVEGGGRRRALGLRVRVRVGVKVCGVEGEGGGRKVEEGGWRRLG